MVYLVRGLGSPSRLVLAAKTAIAAALAWWLAPMIPGTESEYSYYAPLGALVCMYPTLWESARSSVQALSGLLVGVALGLGAVTTVQLGAPAILAVVLVVALGVALGGLPLLGPGRDWISFSALFVLLISGPDASEFSFSYLVTMAFGMVVGVLIQFCTGPPLRLREAHAQFDHLQRALSESLRELAAAVEEPDDASGVQPAVERLGAAADSTRDEIRTMRASQWANPRARRHPRERHDIEARFRALDNAVFFVSALSELLEQRGPVGSGGARSRNELLAEAMRACGGLMTSLGESAARADWVTKAHEALDAYFGAVDEDHDVTHSAIADELTIGSYIVRIVKAVT